MDVLRYRRIRSTKQTRTRKHESTRNYIVLVFLLLAFTLPSLGCFADKSCEFSSGATESAPTIPEGFGVNIDFTEARPGELKQLSQGGFSWVRTDLKWDVTEKEKGKYDFSSYDRLISELKPYGIRALFILDYGNEAFARWSVAAATHFQGQNVLWELYNEPNHRLFWPPKPDAQEYVALALAVGRAWRKSVPDEKLIGPATSEIDFDFLESCFKAGLLQYWSAVSIHPYRHSDPETAAADYCRLRELIKVYAPASPAGPRDKSATQKEIPIIASEWGYSAVWRGFTEQKQAQMLARAWLTNSANGIQLSIWYDWHDDGMDPTEAEHHFGTVANPYQADREPVYDFKPSYLAAQTLTTFLKGYRFERRLPLASDDDYLLVFRNGDALRFATWTTGSSHQVLLPLPAARYSTVGYTGDNERLATSDQQGLFVTLTNSPMYIR